MGINLKQFLSSLSVVNTCIQETATKLTNFILDENNKLDKKVDSKIQKIANIFESDQAFERVQTVDQKYGIQDSPVGTILPYMGIRAPQHYLACDGSEYNIEDYPYLTDHLIREFGIVNYFGGDGETTFAVPDLRGEFLRGAGENGHVNQGSGGEVGEHQDGTSTNIVNVGSGRDIWIQGGADNLQAAFDSITKRSIYRTSTISHGLNTTNEGNSQATSRPTNTSVLYCIKCEPTQFMIIEPQREAFSTEECVVGTWIDGKPIYRKYYDLSSLSITSYDIPVDAPEDLDTFINAKVQMMNCLSSTTYVAVSPHAQIFGQDNYNIATVYNKGTNCIHIMVGLAWKDAGKFDFMFLDYTKTT